MRRIFIQPNFHHCQLQVAILMKRFRLSDTINFKKNIDGIETRFWKMFIVDAFIGNADRNKGNWRVIRHANGTNEIAPVYDNGNSFNNKWDDAKIKHFLFNKDKLIDEAYHGRICIFTKTNDTGNELKINFFHVMQNQNTKNSILHLPKLY